ncbi:MAG: hypothetical protein AB7E72_04950 [Lysobacterales bacterium]
MTEALNVVVESRREAPGRIRRALVWAAMALLVFALIACAGPRRVLGPPSISLQEIETVDGRYVARVRFDSPSSMAVTLQRFDWRLILDQTAAAQGSQPLDQTLPPISGDIVRIDLGPVDSLPALATLTTESTMTYVLEGELKCSDPNVRFDLRYDGRLRATPGKPGSFR